jgi:hypothetical protein
MDSPQPIELERPRSVAEIIAEALEIYQRYPLLFIVLALGVVAPYELAVLAATDLGPLAGGSHASPGVSLLLFLLDYALVGPLVSALHIHGVMLIGQGVRPSLAQVAVRGLRVLAVVVAAVIAAGMGIGLGLIALIIPGILLALRWSVVAQVAAVEHEGWLPSLRRSGELTRGHYWHVFWLLLIIGLLTSGVGIAAQAIDIGSSEGVASVALGIVLRTLTLSFSALALAILYFDLRARQRGQTPSSEPEEERRSDHEERPEPD